MEQKDLSAMSEAELLVRATGIDSELIARALVVMHDDVNIPSVKNLMKIDGVTEQIAEQIMCCVELTARFIVGTNVISCSNPEDVVRRLSWLKYESQEHLFVVTLDSGNHVLGVHEVSKGLVDQTPYHPRETLKYAIADGAASIILVHNHPSGNCEPSPEDFGITRNAIAAGKICQIPLLDHLIISRSSFKSIRRDCDRYDLEFDTCSSTKSTTLRQE